MKNHNRFWTKAIALVTAIGMLLSVGSISAFAQSADSDGNWEQAYPYLASNTDGDQGEYTIQIMTKVEKTGIFFERYVTSVRFYVYDNGYLCTTYTAQGTGFFRAKDIKGVLNQKPYKNIYKAYEELIESECRLMILKEVSQNGKYTDLEQFQENTLNEFRGVESDLQFEMIEETLKGCVDEAFDAANTDAVTEFLKMVFVDGLGLGDDDENFSEVVATQMGNNAFEVLKMFLAILNRSMETITPGALEDLYTETCRRNRQAIAYEIMTLANQ